MDKEPTQEQIRELWEWCGCQVVNLSAADRYTWRVLFPDGHYVWVDNLFETIDLNNLFKYAVPKLQLESKMVELYNYEQSGYKASIYNLFGQVDIPIARVKLNNPVLALFWAIWEVIHG